MRHIPTPQMNKRSPYSTTLAEFKTIEPLEQEDNKKVTLLNGRKNGLFKRISIGLKDYFQRLARDYAMVAKDVAMDAKERPIKVNFYPKNINDLLKAIFMKTLEMLWNYFDI